MLSSLLPNECGGLRGERHAASCLVVYTGTPSHMDEKANYGNVAKFKHSTKYKGQVEICSIFYPKPLPLSRSLVIEF